MWRKKASGLKKMRKWQRKFIDETLIGKIKRPEFRFIFKKSERQLMSPKVKLYLVLMQQSFRQNFTALRNLVFECTAFEVEAFQIIYRRCGVAWRDVLRRSLLSARRFAETRRGRGFELWRRRAVDYSRLSRFFCWDVESLSARVGPDRQGRSPPPIWPTQCRYGRRTSTKTKNQTKRQIGKTRTLISVLCLYIFCVCLTES